MEETQTEAQRIGFESIEWINKKIHWLDEFILSISTLLIGLALMLAFADLGTGGLIFKYDALLIGWGVAIGLGVESQLRALVRRAYNAVREHAYLRALGWSLIAAAIAAVSVVAMVIFSTEKILNLSESAALTLVGISAVTYAQARAVLSVALVIISGIAAYEMKVAKPDTETMLAQIRHERTLLPHQIELDALRAERARQADALKVRRGVGAVKAVASEIRGKGDTGMALTPAMMSTIVDADDDGGDDDDTPPPNGPRGPRGVSPRGRKVRAQILPPTFISGMEIARSTSPLRNARVDAAKEIIAQASGELKLRELADEINKQVTDSVLSGPNAMGIRNEAFGLLHAEGRLPAWAEKYIISAAA